jgi:Domain of unknown function (DUF4159)
MGRLNSLLGALAGLGLLIGLLNPAQADDQSPISNDRITAAVKKAVAWVYQQQNQWGTWEAGSEPKGVQRDLTDQGQFGEMTALAMHTLLTAGESERDPRLAKPVDFLIVNDRIAGVYAVGMRAQVWPLLSPTPAVRQAMVRDRNILIDALHRRGRTRGLYSFRSDYENEPEYADHSVSLYGLLGMKAIADAGIELPESYWFTVDRAWRSGQQRDGSWVFEVGSSAKQEHSMSMTASGVAALFSTTDELAALRPADCQGRPPDRNIENGLNWIDQHFDQSRDPHEIGGFTLYNYALYAVARIGVTSGRKYFNQRDWYEDGAKMLLDSQDASTGAWGNLPDTCFAILFLVRGRDPVIVSKLQYNLIAGTAAPKSPGGSKSSKTPRPPGGATRASAWNLRPRDVANLTDWVGRQVEQDFNWQTVSLKVPVEELHDSAILYVAGNQPLNLSREDKDKLKLYIEEGGIVLGNADCASPDFSSSFRRLGEEMFPAYEFRNVPRDSVIFTGEEFRASKWKEHPQVLELNNGVRDVMLLVPEGDPSHFFELRHVGSWRYLYEMAADILFYSVDQDGARLKGETYIVRPDPSVATQRTVSVARLEYDGNWDPEPGGWTRLAAVMHNTRGIDLQVQSVRLGDGKLNSAFKVAHLTGTAEFHLGDAARAEIRSFVNGGGTLVIDAAGGSAAFDGAAQTEIKAIFPDGNLDVISPDHAVFNVGESLTRAAYRRFARQRIGESMHFRLQGIDSGGRTTVFYSAEDLTEGLVGQPVDGIYGYTPQVATSLMANILTYAAGK